MAKSPLSALVLQCCISITGSGVEKVISVKDLFLHCGFNSILLRQPFVLFNYQQLHLDEKCILLARHWHLMQRHAQLPLCLTHTHTKRLRAASVIVFSSKKCLLQVRFRSLVLLVLSVRIQRRFPCCPFSVGSAQGERRHLSSCMC